MSSTDPKNSDVKEYYFQCIGETVHEFSVTAKSNIEVVRTMECISVGCFSEANQFATLSVEISRTMVHILNHGKPLCGFSNKVPALWPDGNAWISCFPKMNLDESKLEEGQIFCGQCRQSYDAELSK